MSNDSTPHWSQIRPSSGSDILHDPHWNQETAFSNESRERFHLEGLLPYNVENIESQCLRALRHVRSFDEPINKYLYLSSLKSRNTTLFYHLVLRNAEELLPIIYTPTVGQACQSFSFNYRTADGMYLTRHYSGRIRSVLNNWPQPEVDIIVVTDGSRILGLGDLGSNGMGIPIGKLSLYIVGGGFHPMRTLPMMLDVGTNNPKYLDDPMYLGVRSPRLPDHEYFALVDEYMEAVYDKWPHVLVQFEDFSNPHCFDLLEKYRDKYLCFNDDIQGTGAVVAGAFINAVRMSGKSMTEQRLVFFGAGSAGIGVADMIVETLKARGMSQEDARACFWLVDSKGMITADRGDSLTDLKKKFARTDNAGTQCKTLRETIDFVKPTALIGLAGVNGGEFDADVLAAMARHADRPIIFALSNPTSKAECTAEAAYTGTDGRAIFASGSPFAPVKIAGKTLHPGQANNAFIFPGLGFGARRARAKVVSDGMILAACEALADHVTEAEMDMGSVVPSVSRIREVSIAVAVSVMQKAFDEDLAQIDRPDDIESYLRSVMYTPDYQASLRIAHEQSR